MLELMKFPFQMVPNFRVDIPSFSVSRKSSEAHPSLIVKALFLMKW